MYRNHMDRQSQRRNRGFLLTRQGQERLQLAAERVEKPIYQYTLEELNERTGLDPGTIAKVLDGRERVDRRTLQRFFNAFGLQLQEQDYAKPGSVKFTDAEPNLLTSPPVPAPAPLSHPQWWGDTPPDVSRFYGRDADLTILKQWIADESCRLVTLLGLGGMGKTALAAKLAQQVQGQFEGIIWRSLHRAPPMLELVSTVLAFISGEDTAEPPQTPEQGIRQILQSLKQRRVLIILDNLESILAPGHQSSRGGYRSECEAYRALFQALGETPHQSCLLLTSREKLSELARFEGDALPIRSYTLWGLDIEASQQIVTSRGIAPDFSSAPLATLVNLCSGNPQILQMVAPYIQDLFNGDVAAFLREETIILGDICELFDQQFERLSSLEQQVMYWLAIAREPVSLSILRADLSIAIAVSSAQLLEALRSLREKSLVEQAEGQYTQQAIVMEYVTHRIVQRVTAELEDEAPELFISHALIKSRTQDYLRERQIQAILAPIARHLRDQHRGLSLEVEQKLQAVLAQLQQQPALALGYGAGNLMNLCSYLNLSLVGYDFSHLAVRQAHLLQVDLYNVNLAYADLTDSTFAESLDGVLAMGLSRDGTLLAIADGEGHMGLWSLPEGQQAWVHRDRERAVRILALTLDGRLLVSGGEDHGIRLWDVSTGHRLSTWPNAHQGAITAFSFSPDGRLLASGGTDQAIHLWNVNTGQCLQSWQEVGDSIQALAFSPDSQYLAIGGHDPGVQIRAVSATHPSQMIQGATSGVSSLAFSPDGQLLASSDESVVRLWYVATGRCVRLLQGHTDWIRSLAFIPTQSPADNRDRTPSAAENPISTPHQLVTGGADRTVRVWQLDTGHCLQTLEGHTDLVSAVVASARYLVSGGLDRTLKLWDSETGQGLKTLQGRRKRIWAIAFDPDGQHLACGGDDQTITLWDINTGRCLRSFRGHQEWINAVAFSPDGQCLVSGGDDQILKLWNVATGQCLQTLQRHQRRIRSVCFSPTGDWLASSSLDQTIKLWHSATGTCYLTLEGHQGAVNAVAFHPDGQCLASGGDDQHIRLWTVSTGQCIRTLTGHTGRVQTVAFNPTGTGLASGGDDQVIRLWNLETGEYRTLAGHSGRVWSVAFSADGSLLASSSQDQTVRLWDAATGSNIGMLPHTSDVWAVVFNPHQPLLASSSDDPEAIHLWNTETQLRVKSLGVNRPYEGMNITGVTGISEGQRAALKTLGAIEMPLQI